MKVQTKTDKPSRTRKKLSHHDVFFKLAFMDIDRAKELCQMIFTKEERAAFDWNSLRIEKDSFQNHRADAIYSIKFKGDTETRARICLIIEHKAFFNESIYYQLLQYETLVIGRSLKATGEAWPVFCIVFYHGSKPWKWEKSLRKGLWGKLLSKIPSSLRQDMLDSRIRVLDTSSPEVEAAIKNKDIKSRGYLNIFKRSWTLKPELADLEQVLDLFDNCSENEEDLILSLGDYLWAVVPGMTEELWKSLEQLAIKKGIISKGGYMNIKEYIREEARQEGRQEGRQERDQEVILNMLKKNAEISFISEVTGLSPEAIKKFQK